MHISAHQVIDLLRAKHGGDIFVSECKDGPSQFTSSMRMDAWTMNRSWANALTTVYEVKVSRSDFLQDNKWRAYLSYCNAFYFVCPSGLIKPEELPPEAGLMYVATTGTRLFTKKKAPYREVQIPEEVYRYILMCRVRIRDDEWRPPEAGREYWEGWLTTRKADRDFGWRVSKSIRETVNEQIEKVRSKNRELEEENKSLADAKATLKALGIESTYDASRRVTERMKELERLVPSHLLWNIKHAIGELTRLEENLTAHQKQAGVAGDDDSEAA